MAASVSIPPPATSTEMRLRILRAARARFFVHGYSRLTMDHLAAELGMSKKTLYVHFSGKDEIIGAVIEDLGAEIREEADSLIRDRRLNLPEKLRGFIESMVERLANLNPRAVRDLQRFAPALHDRLDEMRRKNIPYVFGRLIEEGQMTGLVRTDLPPAFVIGFFLHAMQGLMQPAGLEDLKLNPRDVVANGIDLFFGGLFTPAGRKQYEKTFPR